MDNRERARARDIKQRRPILLEEKPENFIAVVTKREMLAATEVKMSDTCNISSIKRVTRKFLKGSGCSCAQ